MKTTVTGSVGGAPSTEAALDSASTSGRPRDARARLRFYLVLGPFVLLLVLWIYAFIAEGAFKGGPGGKAFGGDYAMFITAAKIMEHGGNPYNPSVLLREESALMHQLHRPGIKRSLRAQVRVGNPPLLYWAMRPLIGADFVPAALASLIGLYVLSVAGFLALLKYFNWSSRLLATFVFLLMPQVVLGAFYGNVIALVFAGLGFAFLLSRRYPAIAGAIMAVAWLKPPVALPVVLLMALFHVPRARAFVTGFSVASLILLALTILATGWNGVTMWIGGLFRYSSDMSIQPDLISLAGLYSKWMPNAPRIALEAVTLGAALYLTWRAWRESWERDFGFSWFAPLWVVWMLASPYGHFFDEIVLAVPMLALLGRNGFRVTYRAAGLALYLCFVSLFVIQAVPFKVFLLPFPLLAVCWLAYRTRSDPRFASA